MSSAKINLIPITLGYLALPVLIFLLGWLKFAYAVPMAGLLLLLLFYWSGEIRTDARPGIRSLVICGIVALAWTAASGTGGLVFQNGNFFKHNAILKALLSSDWPVLFGPDLSLVYMLAYYLPAAAIGKLFGPTETGWAAVNLAMFTWTAIGVWLTLLWFVHLVRGRPEIFAALFVLLSGMDVIAAQWAPRRGLELELFPDGIGFLQFSGMATALAWAAQHSITAWLGTALFLQLKDEPSFYRNALLFGALLNLWSSFAALGIASLMVAWLVIRPQHLRAVFNPPSALLLQAGGALLLVVVLLFVRSNNFAFLHGVFAMTITEHGLWLRYAFFLAMEFGLVALAALFLTPAGSWQRKLLIALCIVLAVLPLYRIGWAHDMSSRATLPALFALWCLVFSSFNEGQAGLRAQMLRYLVVAAVALGTVSSMGQLKYAVSRPANLQALEEVPDISKPTGEAKGVVSGQYQGNRQSLFFRFLAPDR